MKRILGLLIAMVAFIAPAKAALLVSYDFASDAKAKVHTEGLTARDFNQIGMTAGTTGAGASGSGVYQGNPAPPAPPATSPYSVTGGRWQAVLATASLNTTSQTPNDTVTSALVRIDNTTPYTINLTNFSYTLYNATPSSTGTWANRLIYEQTSIRKSGDLSYTNYSATSTGTTPLTSSAAPEGSTVTTPTSVSVNNRNFLSGGGPLVLKPGEFAEIRVYLRRNNINAASRTFQIDDFRINGDVIPEPASVAIFGGLAAFGLVRRVRRNK